MTIITITMNKERFISELRSTKHYKPILQLYKTESDGMIWKKHRCTAGDIGVEKAQKLFFVDKTVIF